MYAFNIVTGGEINTYAIETDYTSATGYPPVIALQKWLLAVPDTDLADWNSGDLCEDERLDVSDLCLMKREQCNKTMYS